MEIRLMNSNRRRDPHEACKYALCGDSQVFVEHMSDEELKVKIQKGYDEAKAGKVQDAETVFADFREKHK